MKKIFTVDEAQEKLYTALAEVTSFKYLKSQKCLKKVIDNLVFEIDFFSSKWNKSYEIIDIEVQFVLTNKKYGKERVNNVIAEKSFRPKSGWYDISTQTSWNKTYNDLKNEFAVIVDLCNRFEEDFLSAIEYLYNELFEDYNVRIDFVTENLGISNVKEKIEEIYLSIPLEERETYKKIRGELNRKLEMGDLRCLRMDGVKTWMVNRSNWKYVMDSKLMDIKKEMQ
ncbi:MAG: hypothetical protein K6B70_07225 [Clostridia bacterium]|nr:hypothetical protein [Clostridia bacterium]